MTTNAGILTLTAQGGTSTPVNHWDDLSAGIAALRTGPSLAVPDLVAMHPDTWANIRVEKDSMGRYLANADPSSDQADSVWGCDVLQSTAFNPGEALLIDTSLMGRVCVRETLVLRIGYAGTDFTDDVVRWVAEERLNLAVERPSAICWIKGLPAVAPATGTTTGKAKK
jgi:HK97 family phage major capsid protein